jgi:hypothetical protein
MTRYVDETEVPIGVSPHGSEYATKKRKENKMKSVLDISAEVRRLKGP